MGCVIDVIGCDYVTEENFHSEEPTEYANCKDCLNTYNDSECKSKQIDMELKLIFG